MIRAIDTNVFVRLVTGDDPHQAAIAQHILDEDFILTATVMMEIEWVLRSRYRFTVAQRAAALRMLLELPGLVSAPKLAGWAIERMETGADFADMIHITVAEGAASFTTFDASVAAQVGDNCPIAIETLA